MLQLQKKNCHMAEFCMLQTKFMESNVVNSEIEDERDAEALFVTEKEDDELSLTTTQLIKSTMRKTGQLTPVAPII